jgi:hypothetical protein
MEALRARKKWGALLAALITCVVFLKLIETKGNDKSVHTQVRITQEQQEREDQLNALFTEMDTIVQQTHDKQAQQVFDFITQHVVLGAPVPQGVVGLSHWKPNPLAVVPMVPHDETVSPDWAAYAHAPEVGRYLPGMKAIILPPFGYSLRAKALVTFHEGQHALDDANDAMLAFDKKQRDEEEFTTHLFQWRLTAEVSGKPYQQAVTWAVEALRRRGPLGDVGQTGQFMVGDDARIDLTHLYGKDAPALNQNEIDFRQTHLWMDATTRHLGECYPAQRAHQLQVHLIKMLDHPDD